MPLVNMKPLLRDAMDNGYAVAAFNLVDYNTTKAMVKAAEELNAPVICQTSAKTIKYFSHKEIVSWVRTVAEDSPVPVVLHLDHCKDIAMIEACAKAGWTSIMIDASELPFDQNLAESLKVREIAEKYELATAKKKDSTGICFIGERRFSDFLKQYLPAQPGEIKTTDGEVIGRHHGLMYHTIGQRQGLGIGGLKDAGEEPWYVLVKDLEHNVLIVGQGNEHPLLFSGALLASEIYWVNPIDLSTPRRLTAKVRYRQSDQPCVLEKTATGYRATFDDPQRAVTPGQSVVFYDGEICLGGGVIEVAEAWSNPA